MRMQRELAEETVIFVSIVKWVLLAGMIGIVVGLSTAGFLKLLSWGIGTAKAHPYYYLVLPLGLFVSALLVKYLAKDAEGHGTEKVIEAVHKRFGEIKLKVVPVKVLATIITIATGGSAGKEGPSAQIGSGLSSWIANFLRFTKIDRKKLVICGISAGFSAVFGTPIAGAIFGVEVLFVGSILYEVLLPSFIAGIVAYHVAAMFGIEHLHSIIFSIPEFNQVFLLKVIIAGVFFGLVAFLIINLFKYIDKISHKVRIWTPLKAFLAGILLVILAHTVSTQYLGLGLDTIDSALSGAHIIWYAFLMKAIFTGITLSFGGSGGIITPLFFIGAAAGSLFGQMSGLDTGVFAAIGFVAILAGATNTPIAASIMALELFGTGIAPYAALACVIAFLMTGHRSVYPSQVLSTTKSAALTGSIGKEMENIESNVEFHDVGDMFKRWGEETKHTVRFKEIQEIVDQISLEKLLQKDKKPFWKRKKE
ncbi:MAG: chloride channel protein [Nanoarchaeota archaeon]